MNAEDFMKLSSVLRLACDIYRQPFTEELVKGYATVLNGSDMMCLEEAARTHFLSSRFFPSPSDLLGVNESVLRLQAGDDWLVLRKGKGSLIHAKPATDALELVGGHMMLRDMTWEQEPHRRREFIEAYLALYRDDLVTGAIEASAADKLALPS